jgi:hypothetical protein
LTLTSGGEECQRAPFVLGKSWRRGQPRQKGPGADIAARLQNDVWANCRRPEKHSLVLDITGPQPCPI